MLATIPSLSDLVSKEELGYAESIVLRVLVDKEPHDVESLIEKVKEAEPALSAGVLMTVVWSLVGSGRARYNTNNDLCVIA